MRPSNDHPVCRRCCPYSFGLRRCRCLHVLWHSARTRFHGNADLCRGCGEPTDAVKGEAGIDAVMADMSSDRRLMSHYSPRAPAIADMRARPRAVQGYPELSRFDQAVDPRFPHYRRRRSLSRMPGVGHPDDYPHHVRPTEEQSRRPPRGELAEYVCRIL